MVAPQAAPSYQPQPGNGLAVAGMVLGIIGLALCWIPFAGWLCALIGVILGALGISKAKKLGGKGKGMAIAGLVCGIVGLAIGVLLFVLAMMAAKAFDTYVEKGRRSESSLQLRSIERRVKAFYVEQARYPKSAPEMPGAISSVCSNPNAKFPVVPQSQWTEGWRELDFSILEPSRCSYELVSVGQEAKAIARCDLDCDGNVSVTTVTFTAAQGNVTATTSEPTPD
jgi:hypothetical protein